MDIGGFDCGCDTRKETIGSANWWTMVTVGGAVLIVALTRGGNVSKQTKNIIRIGAAGAIVAIIADKYVNPKVKGNG